MKIKPYLKSIEKLSKSKLNIIANKLRLKKKEKKKNYLDILHYGDERSSKIERLIKSNLREYLNFGMVSQDNTDKVNSEINKLREKNKIMDSKYEHINIYKHLYDVAKARYLRVKKLIKKKFEEPKKNLTRPQNENIRENMSKYQELSEKFIRNFKIDWENISKYQQLSETFIENFKIDWENISKYQQLSETFIGNNEINLENISEYQQLSETFIGNNEINLENISEYRQLSETFCAIKYK
jgi:hypothetical protein